MNILMQNKKTTVKSKKKHGLSIIKLKILIRGKTNLK